MTVSELITALSQYGPDRDVWLEGEYDLVPVHRVGTEAIISGEVVVIR